MNYWPFLIVIVLLGALTLFTRRNRRRQLADETARVSRIGVGTEVMTTSGLYGTVVARHDDATVLLAIAPGVEVRWAAAALRDAESLADTYRRGLDTDSDGDRNMGVGSDSDIDIGMGSATSAAGGGVQALPGEPEGADLRKKRSDGAPS